MTKLSKLLLLFTFIPLMSCSEEGLSTRPPISQRLYMTQHIETVAGSSAYIILDTKTSSEYLVVENTSRGIAILPLPSKKAE